MKRKSKVLAAVVVIAIAGVAGFVLYGPEESVISKGGSVIVRGASDDFLVIRSDHETNYIAKDKIGRISVDIKDDDSSSVTILGVNNKLMAQRYYFKSREDSEAFAERLYREVDN